MLSMSRCCSVAGPGGKGGSRRCGNRSPLMPARNWLSADLGETVLLQLVGNFLDARIRAGFVLIAARSAADADGANGFCPCLDRNAALHHDGTWNVRRRRHRPKGLGGFSRRPPEKQRRVSLASAEIGRARAGAVVTEKGFKQAAIVDDRYA